MMPENVATSSPRFRLNSLMAARFCSSDISRSLETPAAPANADPRQADRHADQDHLARLRAQHFAGERPAERWAAAACRTPRVYPSATAIPSDMPR